jgi:hypothetical protein
MDSQRVSSRIRSSDRRLFKDIPGIAFFQLAACRRRLQYSLAFQLMLHLRLRVSMKKRRATGSSWIRDAGDRSFDLLLLLHILLCFRLNTPSTLTALNCKGKINTGITLFDLPVTIVKQMYLNLVKSIPTLSCLDISKAHRVGNLTLYSVEGG